MVKNPPAMQETWVQSIQSTDLGSIPGLGRFPAEGKGYPLQYSGLENFMDCIVHGVTESDTTEQLSLSIRTTAQKTLLSTLVMAYMRKQ